MLMRDGLNSQLPGADDMPVCEAGEDSSARKPDFRGYWDAEEGRRFDSDDMSPAKSTARRAGSVLQCSQVTTISSEQSAYAAPSARLKYRESHVP